VSDPRRESRHDMTTQAQPETPVEHSIPAPQPVFTTDELFAGTKEIGIQHLGSTYRLRITRQGKLVLNK